MFFLLDNLSEKVLNWDISWHYQGHAKKLVEQFYQFLVIRQVLL